MKKGSLVCELYKNDIFVARADESRIIMIGRKKGPIMKLSMWYINILINNGTLNFTEYSDTSRISRTSLDLSTFMKLV
jgi:hypothetical protein